MGREERSRCCYSSILCYFLVSTTNGTWDDESRNDKRTRMGSKCHTGLCKIIVANTGTNSEEARHCSRTNNQVFRVSIYLSTFSFRFLHREHRGAALQAECMIKVHVDAPWCEVRQNRALGLYSSTVGIFSILFTVSLQRRISCLMLVMGLG